MPNKVFRNKKLENEFDRIMLIAKTCGYHFSNQELQIRYPDVMTENTKSDRQSKAIVKAFLNGWLKGIEEADDAIKDETG